MGDLKEALFARATDMDMPLEFIEDISFTPTPEVLASYSSNPEQCVAELAEQIFPGECAECSAASGSTGLGSPHAHGDAITPMATKTYNAKVFAGVPAGGVCQIRQDFRATVSNYKVSKVSILGSSYVVGVCLFQWSPNRQWYQVTGKLFNLFMKGVFSAVIKGGPISFSGTFKAIYDVRKNDLVQHKQ